PAARSWICVRDPAGGGFICVSFVPNEARRQALFRICAPRTRGHEWATSATRRLSYREHPRKPARSRVGRSGSPSATCCARQRGAPGRQTALAYATVATGALCTAGKRELTLEER